MDVHHPLNQDVADEAQRTPWRLEEYTVYVETEEGKEHPVFSDPSVEEGNAPSVSQQRLHGPGRRASLARRARFQKPRRWRSIQLRGT
ncbi:hypothetical protein NDU88_007440 [Pleurodeles waltl]|uniref:Uncharacterized protein n=1 Tax=Pleurodeles waltl TaxID=8319 RepID=A0AAV7WH21_PLEWA|nr:hypothetical protein NDU88_007440 [Pleurodeles waltl]